MAVYLKMPKAGIGLHQRVGYPPEETLLPLRNPVPVDFLDSVCSVDVCSHRLFPDFYAVETVAQIDLPQVAIGTEILNTVLCNESMTSFDARLFGLEIMNDC